MTLAAAHQFASRAVRHGRDTSAECARILLHIRSRVAEVVVNGVVVVVVSLVAATIVIV